MEQLRKIRQKKHLQKVAADEARIKALTNEVVFVAPTFDSNKSTLMDTPDIELSERDIVQAMEYSGCADELERFAAAIRRCSDKRFINFIYIFLFLICYPLLNVINIVCCNCFFYIIRGTSIFKKLNNFRMLLFNCRRSKNKSFD